MHVVSYCVILEMTVNIEDLYGNSGIRFKKINTHQNFQQSTSYLIYFTCFLLAHERFFPNPLRFKPFPLNPRFHSKRKDEAIHSSSECPMREAKNAQLKMFKQPQIQHRIQTNMSLFHFTSLAKQSGHCNRRQAAVCFQKSKQKDAEEACTFPPRQTTDPLA